MAAEVEAEEKIEHEEMPADDVEEDDDAVDDDDDDDEEEEADGVESGT